MVIGARLSLDPLPSTRLPAGMLLPVSAPPPRPRPRAALGGLAGAIGGATTRRRFTGGPASRRRLTGVAAAGRGGPLGEEHPWGDDEILLGFDQAAVFPLEPQQGIEFLPPPVLLVGAEEVPPGDLLFIRPLTALTKKVNARKNHDGLIKIIKEF